MDRISPVGDAAASRQSRYSCAPKDFRDFGKNISLFPGVSDWFKRINAYARTKGVRLEHFIISSGIREMVEGTPIYKEFKKVYASGFMFDHNGVACWPALAVNYTTKTQYLFRINKGSLDVHDKSMINRLVPKDQRPVPFENIIFMATAETDIPCMRLVRDQGGHSIAVQRQQAWREEARRQLVKDGRATLSAAADFQDSSTIDGCVKAIIDRWKPPRACGSLVMDSFRFDEKFLSQIPALQVLVNLGYQYLTPAEALAAQAGRASNVLLEEIVREQLKKLNRIQHKGGSYLLGEENVQSAIQRLKNVKYDGLLKTNEAVYDLLTLGVALEQSIEGDLKSFTLSYVDWRNPANNVYHVAAEFAVERTRSIETCRPDLVLFVNGIPFAVIECKSPTVEVARPSPRPSATSAMNTSTPLHLRSNSAGGEQERGALRHHRHPGQVLVEVEGGRGGLRPFAAAGAAVAGVGESLAVRPGLSRTRRP